MDSVDFANAISGAFAAARRHATLVRYIDEAKHITICEQLETRVGSIFAEAVHASDGALRSHQERDAGRAMVYSLGIWRDRLTSATLHFRIDATETNVRWQLREGAAMWEFAGWGWFVVPVLTVPDFDTYIQQKVLDLISTLREDDTTGRIFRGKGSRF